MLRFVDIPHPFQVVLMISLLISLGFSFFLWMLTTTIRRKFITYHYSAIMWISLFIVLFLLQIELDTGKALISWYPVWAHVIFVAAMFVMNHVAYISEISRRRSNFTRNTVREALDNLPMGLCFSNAEGRIFLANRSLYQLARQFTGVDINNLEVFWKLINEDKLDDKTLRLIDYCTDNMVTLRTAGDDIYQVMRKTVVIGHNNYTETSVYKVTRLHELREEIASENERLKQQRVEIRELADKMVRLNHEEELINRKIQIHNEMGQYILATRQLLQKGGSIEEYYSSAIGWQNMTRQSISMEDKYKKNYSELLDEIISIANDIGCQVIIEDSVPMELFEEPLARQAVRESIINAVRHGGASEIHLDCENNKNEIKLIISNNGEFEDMKAKPRGGLKNLEDGLRSQGGKLEILAKDKFSVIITFPIKIQGD